MGRHALHPGVLDSEFLLEQSDLVVSAVDLGLEPNLAILAEGRPRKEHREAVVAEGQDVENGGADAMLPAAGQGQFGGIGTSVRIFCNAEKGALRAVNPAPRHSAARWRRRRAPRPSSLVPLTIVGAFA